MTEDKDNFTTLIGVKWNKNSMIEVHRMMYDYYIKKLLNNKRLTIKEKNRRLERLDPISEWFILIQNLCLNDEIAFKKK
jgi:transcriptional antiterminator